MYKCKICGNVSACHELFHGLNEAHAVSRVGTNGKPVLGSATEATQQPVK